MKTLPLDNDFEPEYAVSRKNGASGAEEAAPSLTGLTARLSATDGGSAIHASLSVSVAERTSKPGTYFGTFQGNDLRTHCASLVGTIGYVVFGDGVNVLVSEPHLIVRTRRPDVP